MLMNFPRSLCFGIKAVWKINLGDFQDVNSGFHEASLKTPSDILVWVVFSFSHLHTRMRHDLCQGWPPTTHIFTLVTMNEKQERHYDR